MSVLKYTRKVFYDNLWHLDERLLECRGIVVDENDNVIVLPFKKVFNLGENGVGEDIPCNTRVEAVRKMNGFMAAATMTDKYGLIISTTGTLDFEYAILARTWIEHGFWYNMKKGKTYLFEICDNHDPHIIKEKAGAYLIGVRDIQTGKLHSEFEVTESAWDLDYLRPSQESVRRPTLWDLKDRMKHCKHEGYMVGGVENGEMLFKWKSPYYLSKKALQRCGKTKASKMWNNPELFKQQLDEEFYSVFDKILDTFTQEEYLNLTEQERRKWIEDYFEGA